jgi:tetratricopeptide (TPR) repeat protein
MIAVCLTAVASGCRLSVWDGPISRSLASSRTLCQQGVSAMDYEQMDRAEKLLGQAVRACPANGEARRHYAEALWKQGSREKAIAQLVEAIRQGNEDAEIYVTLAQMRLELGQRDAARSAAERAVDLDPKLAPAWGVRAQIARLDGNASDALAYYQRAMGLAPDDRELRLAVAELYLDGQHPQRALATLQSLADTYTPGEEPAAVLRYEGIAYMAMSRFDEAADVFAQAAGRGEPDPELLCRLGEAQLLAGRPDHAADSARRALELNPNYADGRALQDRIDVAWGLQPVQR